MCQTNELIENGLHNRKSVLSRFPLACHRFLISASQIHFKTKKVLFTKGILFAYQSVRKKKSKGEKKTPRRRKSVNPRFISELFSPSSLKAKDW